MRSKNRTIITLLTIVLIVSATGLRIYFTRRDSAQRQSVKASKRVATSLTNSTCGKTENTPPSRYDHIVVIVDENRTWNDVGMGFDSGTMPFMHKLASQCGYFPKWNETNAHQNSLNQYIGMTSGINNTRTVDDCSPSSSCRSSDDNIFRQVRRAGGTARNFVDGATTQCSASGNAAKHIPALYYYGEYVDGGTIYNDHQFCSSEIQPLSEFDVNQLPTFSFLSPDLCNDGHDCNSSKVDAWNAIVVSKVTNSASYATGKTAVFVFYDEDRPVPNLIIAPTAKPGATTGVVGSHASALRSWEEMLGLPYLGDAANASDLRKAANF